MTTDEKDFLSRWSRRKQAVREGLVEPEPEPEQPAVPAESAAPEPLVEDVPADAPAFDDVDFDALNYESDYTRFMAEDVPEMVRRRALRALWRSDPILANVDGLNDYDEDFTDAALVVENLASAYKPGKGYASDDEQPVEEERVGDAEETPPAEPLEQPLALEQADDAALSREDTHSAEARPAASPDGEDASKA